MRLMDEETVPIAEIDGRLRFMSEVVSGWRRNGADWCRSWPSARASSTIC